MQRLKTRAQFLAAMSGTVVSRTPHFILHRGLLPGAQASLGALVPKRWARRAVTRNAIRRQIYALGAQHMPVLAPAPPASVPTHPAFVVRLRAAFDRQQFPSAQSHALKHAVHNELLQLFGSQASTARA